LYGLRSLGLEAGETPLSSIEEMATHYLPAIRTLDPMGPYHLGGWSMGGIIALEMARQLVAEGVEVAGLTLIDTHLPDPNAENLEDDQKRFWRAFAQELGLGNKAITFVEKHLKKRAKPSLEQRFATLLKAAHTSKVLPPSFDIAEIEARFAVFSACVRAIEHHEVQPLVGVPTLLVEAQDRVDRGGLELAPLWRPIIREAPLYAESLSGNHRSILTGTDAVRLARLLECFTQSPELLSPCTI
jgi:thioesterase domain-containing protein